MRTIDQIRRDAAELDLVPEEFGRYVEENLEAEEARAIREGERSDWEEEKAALERAGERR